MGAEAGDAAYARARPLWAEVDLGAITHNLALVRERAGRPVRVLAAVKADAYGHGVVPVGRHLAGAGVDGLATANLDDAIRLREAGLELPILLYGSPLPDGFGPVLDHGLTPTVYDAAAVAALERLAAGAPAPVPVHVKVDAGLGRLGVRPDEAPALVREVLAARHLLLEGIYTHIPFSDAAGEAWSRRRLDAFAALVGRIEAEHGIAVRYAEASASSVLAAGLADGLNTVAPGHVLFGLNPLAGRRAEELGFRKALTALRARLIHVGRREAGDDLLGAGPGGLEAAGRAGVVLFGIDNGYRAATSPRGGRVLIHGRRCRVLGVSAEYTVVDLAGVPEAEVGDEVTVIGADGDDAIAVEDVAAQLGAPSAAYWMVGMKNVPIRYR